MNKVKKAVLAVAVGLGLKGWAQAAIPSDSLTVTITPNAYYAVSVTTNSAALDLGTVNLNTSTQTVRPSTVTIQSTYATTGLKLQGSIASAGTAWSFSADSTTVANNTLVAWAVFTDTSVSAAPGQTSGYFNGTTQGATSDMFDATLRIVGNAALTNTAFLANVGDAGYKTMQSLPPDFVDLASSRAHLWLRFRLPGTTSTTNAQNVTVTLTAGAPN